MLRTLFLLCALALPASAGYDEAGAALKGVEGQAASDLDGWLAQPGDALARSEKATALLADNQPALELFRGAAAEKNGGYLLAPKPEKLTVGAPAPKYGPHVKLFKLALLDAKVKAARGQRAQAEADLLAAAGLLAQLSSQKSFRLLSSMMWQLCLQKSFPVFSGALRDPKASPAFLKGLAERLGEAAGAQDFMQAALAEELEMEKNSVREGVTPEKLGLERAKLPFLQRFAAGRLQDAEFVALVFARFDAAADGRGQALARAFRENDAAGYGEFVKKQLEEARARKGAYSSRALWAKARSLLGGAEAKAEMAQFTADTLTEITSPDYGRLVPRYHVGLNQLAVLRAALAAKLYQRAKRRLPAALAELSPEFLSAAPQDTFGKGGALSYAADKKKFRVYSFGPDGKDDKGALELDLGAYSENPAMNAGDIVYAD